MLFFPRHITVILFVWVLFYASRWSEIVGQNRDGTTTASQASSTVFTTAASPMLPAPGSFFLRSLLRNCSPDMAQVNGSQWEEEIRFFLQRSFKVADRSYSCSARCGLEQRNASLPSVSPSGPVFLPFCYCDELCDDFGDCCFDFDELCRQNINPQKSNQTSNEICFDVKRDEVSAYPGYVIWKTCPKNWKERSTLQKCQDEDETDLLRNLPVFDEDSHKTYKNVFCARCNGALNTTYWKIVFDCQEWFNVTTFNLISDLGLLEQRCSIDKRPKKSQLSFLKRCIPRFKDCSNQEKNDTFCQTECLRYAFPVCVGGLEKLRFRNPQCALCNGFNTSVMESICDDVSGIPPLTILFDFTSTSKYSIVIRDNVKYALQRVEQTWSCSSDEVYDPYAGSCTKIIPTVLQTDHDSGRNVTEEWNANCTAIAINGSRYERLSNGSIYLKLHDKIYNNNTFMISGNKLLLCANFSRNFTAAVKGPRMLHKVRASLQLLTSIGYIVSMVSLVLLLITYILFPELRNLPGKIIINLAISLLLCQSVFFSAVKNHNPNSCYAVAVFLHFFVLSSFTWMNVMAFDVHRTFTNASGVAANQLGGLKTRFIKYCVYAWGAPAVVVLVCIISDQVEKGSIGYGQGEKECFISQPQALLFSLIVPVALLMLLNLFAFGNTTTHIVKTRKRSQRVTNQRQGGNVAVICIKMASVMGITWILGFAANLKALSFLWYPYIVLNSLQGLFIFLSFAASGKALDLYKSKLTSVMKDCTQKEDDYGGLNHNCDKLAVICHSNEGQVAQDTRL